MQSKTYFILPSDIANLYALIGKKEQALKLLDQAYEEHDPALIYLLFPIYESLRNELSFQEIARKINLPYK
jgi:hypothetical protein